MKIRDEAFFKAIRDFLTVYLPKQRCYSPNTVTSYRITLNLFVDFMVSEKHIPLYKLSFDHFKANIISDYLDWLQAKRGCSSSTRNQRLMALKSFTKYAGLIDAAQVSVHMELGKIPIQKSDTGVVEYLAEDALKALLEQPNSKRPTDIRNRFLMIFMYDTAARCQEILDLRLKDFELNAKSPYVYLHGKGNKTRTVPLMSKTVQHYLAYLNQFHPEAERQSGNFVFYTTIHGKRGQMSPDNVEYFMKRYGEKAKLGCSNVPNRVHPHQLRHTRAIHLYRGGMPLALLSEFLGHAGISTTQVYAYADTEMKRQAIQKACPQNHAEPTEPEKPIWENNEDYIRKLYGLL
jgi:site-specific recombinase XerD